VLPGAIVAVTSLTPLLSITAATNVNAERQF
jgi:hypothetical protein